jgi:hypothetical protein
MLAFIASEKRADDPACGLGYRTPSRGRQLSAEAKERHCWTVPLLNLSIPTGEKNSVK